MANLSKFSPKNHFKKFSIPFSFFFFLFPQVEKIHPKKKKEWNTPPPPTPPPKSYMFIELGGKGTTKWWQAQKSLPRGTPDRPYFHIIHQSQDRDLNLFTLLQNINFFAFKFRFTFCRNITFFAFEFFVHFLQNTLRRPFVAEVFFSAHTARILSGSFFLVQRSSQKFCTNAKNRNRWFLGEKKKKEWKLPNTDIYICILLRSGVWKVLWVTDQSEQGRGAGGRVHNRKKKFSLVSDYH